MYSNRLVSRQQASALDLSTRVEMERQITDAMDEKVKIPSLPSDWTFETYAHATPWRKYLFDFLGPLEGKTVLDLGCGYHPTSIYFALAGAKKVYACDVSPKALEHIQNVAREFDVEDRVEVMEAPAEQLPIASNEIDLMHGEAVLHHLNLALAGQELSRVMTRGGKAGFKDPLGQNPLLEFARDYLPYRWKHAVKGTDRPLNYRAVREFGRHFDDCNYRGFGLASLAVLGVTGNRESNLYQFSHKVDDVVLGTVPFLGRFGRFIVTCVTKQS